MPPVVRDYPVQVEITSPERFDRRQLLVRFLLAIVVGWFGVTAGWLAGLLYFALPVASAIAISSRGRRELIDGEGRSLWGVLAWLVQFSAYMMLIVDAFPTGDPHPVRVQIRFTGAPSVGSALLRLVTSIPSGVALMVLWMLSGILWVVAAIVVLVGARMPGWVLAYQRGVLRWMARLLAYHASLVEEYPPFDLATQPLAAEAA